MTSGRKIARCCAHPNLAENDYPGIDLIAIFDRVRTAVCRCALLFCRNELRWLYQCELDQMEHAHASKRMCPADWGQRGTFKVVCLDTRCGRQFSGPDEPSDVRVLRADADPARPRCTMQDHRVFEVRTSDPDLSSDSRSRQRLCHRSRAQSRGPRDHGARP